MNAEFNKLRNIIGDKDTVDELIKLLTDEQINAFIEHVKAHYDLEWHKRMNKYDLCKFYK